MHNTPKSLANTQNELASFCWTLLGELRKSWLVFVLEAVRTNLACVQLPFEKATCRYAVRCLQNVGKANGYSS